MSGGASGPGPKPAAGEHPTAGLIVVGNEILSGKVVDSNTPFLARELRSLGTSLERVVVIPDDTKQIAAEVAAFSRAYDAVFTSGGVGPTHDDVTMEGVAAAFGVPVVEDPGLRAALEGYFGSRLNAAHLKMAQVPSGAELVLDRKLGFPTVVMGNVYVLPGIPRLFEAKVVALRDRFRGLPFHLRQVLVKPDETVIAQFLDATLAAFPGLLLGSYPILAEPEYRVRLTLESRDRDYVEQALADLLARLPAGSVFRVES